MYLCGPAGDLLVALDKRVDERAFDVHVVRARQVVGNDGRQSVGAVRRGIPKALFSKKVQKQIWCAPAAVPVKEGKEVLRLALPERPPDANNVLHLLSAADGDDRADLEADTRRDGRRLGHLGEPAVRRADQLADAAREQPIRLDRLAEAGEAALKVSPARAADERL